MVFISKHEGNGNVEFGMLVNASEFKGALNIHRYQLKDSP